MTFLLGSGHILLAAICGLANQRQRSIIEFRNAQIEALLNTLRGRCVCVNHANRELCFSSRMRVAKAADRFVFGRIGMVDIAGGLVISATLDSYPRP